MGKQASDIVKWGVVKPFFDKTYKFNSIDIETVDNELFLFGYTKDDNYHYTLNSFYDTFHDFIIYNIRLGYDVLTWSRYDNTHLVKLILKDVRDPSKVLLKIGKISPVYEYTYKSFTFTIQNIIKDSIIIKVTDKFDKSRTCTVYNLKNLYTKDLTTTAKDYNVSWYSKLGEEYHIIDKLKFENDKEYKRLVLLSNEYDNRVLIEIATKFLENFKSITGVYPKSIFTAGSIARSYLLAHNKKDKIIDLQFRSTFSKTKKRDALLDYSMKSYHGGKIESYILGYVKNGFIIDITSAYPSALATLPKLTNKIVKRKGKENLDEYYYAFIHCDIMIMDENLIHPLVVESPINLSNISPWGYIKDVIITKIEYDYMKENGCQITVHDYIAVEHEEVYPYRELVQELFDKRMIYKNEKNNSLADLYKTILNSLYGITYELTDVYGLERKEVVIERYKVNEYENLLKPYKKNINLSNIKSDLKYIYDTDYRKIMAMWNNKNCTNYPDTVKQELEEQGLFINSDHPADILQEINNLYRGGKVYENKIKVESIEWLGFRAGDYFNPVISSYITAITRTYLSRVSHDIILNGGDVYLNMTDSIIYNGNITLDIFSDKKILGKFDKPEKLKDIIILGAGRYEYKSEFTDKYTIKNRGFSVKVKDKSFYTNLDLTDSVKIPHKTFVTSFKATTNKYDYKRMGHLIDDNYVINPFNLGGKRVIINRNVNLKKEFTKTKPVYIDKAYYR